MPRGRPKKSADNENKSSAKAGLQQRQQQQQRHKCTKELVLRQFPVLRILLKSKNSRLRAELLRLSPDTVHALCSIAHNIRAGNIPVTSNSLKKRLTNINPELNVLTSPKVSAKRKSILLTSKHGQKGGFLSLLPRIIPGIMSILGLGSSSS